jgi:dTDP-4-amino-4,6-dideoxygalactose transaminase
MKIIPFNKPHLTGKETHYLYDSVNSGHISGNGIFTKKCHKFFEDMLGSKKVLLTTSCTDALEMSAILCNIQKGDQVIIPSYTFVSTALAFVREGAEIIFADSKENSPCIDESKIEALITDKTKVIVVVHYAGIACDMDIIMELAYKYNLIVIEDAAQAIDSYYKGKPLGSIGHLGAFSFHETKNLQCGEGGLLSINDPQFVNRAEVIWEKGTNRAEFFRGEINKYGWVDIGSSFLPSDYVAGFLYAQLEMMEDIQSKRKSIWDKYNDLLKPLEAKGFVKLPVIPSYASNNAHMYYIICNSLDQRSQLIAHLKSKDVFAVFHYLSLHKSKYYIKKYKGIDLVNSDNYENTLLRLPLYYDLSIEEVEFVAKQVIDFFQNSK